MSYTVEKTRITRLQSYGFNPKQIAFITGYDAQLIKKLKTKPSQVDLYDLKNLSRGQRSYYVKCKDILRGKKTNFIKIHSERSAEKQDVILAASAITPKLKPVSHRIKNITTDKPISLVIGPEEKALLIDIEMLPNGIKITW